jgi:hypothetical protein
VHHSILARPTSATGVNSLHYRAAALLSASPQLAESIRAAKRFRVVPIPDLSRCSKRYARVDLFDHLVGRRQQTRRYFEAERSGGLQIDDKLEFGRLEDR